MFTFKMKTKQFTKKIKTWFKINELDKQMKIMNGNTLLTYVNPCEHDLWKNKTFLLEKVF